MKVFDRIITNKKVLKLKIIRIFVCIGLFCAIVEFLRFPKIYILVAFVPQDVPRLYKYDYHHNGNNIKPYKNTFSYRIYLIKKLRKEHFDICLCGMCLSDYYGLDYYGEKSNESTANQ